MTGEAMSAPAPVSPVQSGQMPGGLAAGPTAEPGIPVLRWSSRAHSIPEIEIELARIWASTKLTTEVDGREERRVAARTSVMNLVVVARRSEIGEHAASIISQLTGRHPSRTMILSTADPDGPAWLDAQIQAHCILPRADAPETCAEMIYLTAGGETGHHPDAVIGPLLIHDLPVTVWWPGEPPFGSHQAQDVFSVADRVVVDGSGWSGDGLDRLRKMAELLDDPHMAVSDFALIRQSRWREAIASAFDMPDLLPFVRSLRRISVTYGTHDETGTPGGTNVVKPLYHVAWLASRLGMRVHRPLAALPSATRAKGPARPGAHPPMSRGLGATLHSATGDVSVIVRPIHSTMPSGTTLRVELLAERRGSELRVEVTAESETVMVHAWLDGVELLRRSFLAPRRTELDLLAESIEAVGRDPVATDAIRMAAALATPSGGATPAR